MDALLSLPLLSAIALPAFSSYGTSLNLLFFYMTWATLVMSHPPLRVELFGALFARTLFFIIPSLLSLILDTAFPSVAVYIKAQGDVALPARKNASKPAIVAAWATFNVLLGIALQAAVEGFFTKVLEMRSVLKVTTGLPMPWGIMKDLFRTIVLRGILQYYIHRFVLHHPNSPIARWHQSWQHSVRTPYAFVANFDHPLTWVLGRWLPVYLPALLFRLHVLTFHLLLVLVSLEEFFVFSGYSMLPSTIILGGIARRQDAHFMSGGKGNFAPWGILDWMHGTTVGDEDFVDDVKMEIEKRGGERGEEVVNGSTSPRQLLENVVGDKVKGKGRGRPKKINKES